MKPHQSDFQPNWSSAPGETIADLLEEQKVSVSQFARAIGRTVEQAQDLLNGCLPVTSTLAKMLEAVIGGSKNFWARRESDYRVDLARLEQEAERKSAADWLDELPRNEMANFRWIDSSARNQTNELLRFFDVPDVASWREKYRKIREMAAFRTSSSFESDSAAVAVWLRRGEIEATRISCKAWDPQEFTNVLPRVRALTRQREPRIFLPDLREMCAQCGVATVILRAPKGCRASGATRFLTPNKALLLLSFRYLSDDHFWFTFFHEAGHLLLHGGDALFLEGVQPVSEQQEEEANQFAAEKLIPQSFIAEMERLPVNGIEIIRFARKVGIAPGIVVGQLQHRGRLTHRQLNNLKKRFSWV